MLESLAKHYAFDIEAPFESLPAPVQHAILHGSGEEEIAFSYIMDSGASKGKVYAKKHPFEGIIPNMSRRYRETDSVVVREDLARFRSTQPCPECHGTRLRREARHVRLGGGGQRRDPLRRRGAAHPPGLANWIGPDGRDVRAGRAQHRPAPARQ